MTAVLETGTPAPRVPGSVRVPPAMPWPRARIVATLAVVALGVGGLALLLPMWNPWLSPAVLALATLGVGVQVFRRSSGLDPVATTTWRGFGAIAGLLAASWTTEKLE